MRHCECRRDEPGAVGHSRVAHPITTIIVVIASPPLSSHHRRWCRHMSKTHNPFALTGDVLLCPSELDAMSDSDGEQEGEQGAALSEQQQKAKSKDPAFF